MRHALIMVSAFVLGASLLGCESDKSTNSNGGSEAQIMYVYAQRCAYWDEDSIVTAATVGGVILGDPLPRFSYIKVNNSTFAGDEYCSYYVGYCSFGSFG